MGSESIAHEAEGRMGYWLRGHEGERNNSFSKIQLVHIMKTSLLSLDVRCIFAKKKKKNQFYSLNF